MQTMRKQTQLEYERSTVKRHIKIGAVNKAIAFYDERHHSATPAAMIYWSGYCRLCQPTYEAPTFLYSPSSHSAWEVNVVLFKSLFSIECSCIFHHVIASPSHLPRLLFLPTFWVCVLMVLALWPTYFHFVVVSIRMHILLSFSINFRVVLCIGICFRFFRSFISSLSAFGISMLLLIWPSSSITSLSF